MNGRFARVAVERGIDRYPDGLTYAVPPALADLRAGERVLVPLGKGGQPAPAYVIEIADETSVDPAAIKRVAQRDPAGSALPADLVELARWISSYYCAPLGLTLAGMLPAAVRRAAGAVTRTLVDRDPAAPLPARLPPKQQAVLAALPAAEAPIEMRALAERAGVGTLGPIQRLLRSGILRSERRTSVEAEWLRQAPDRREPPTLTAAQGEVVEAVDAARSAGFSVHLLHGVTGSGKTEVYLRLVERTVARGEAAIVLVPEISLTPQTGGRFIGRFAGTRVAVLHSALTAAQRNQQWSLAARGEAAIVIGARSAVFAPTGVRRLGIVIVDEEQDSSYKQDQTPRYHGRDVAIRRAQLAGCPILLGSATPSLESWFNATERGIYRLHRLPERAPGLRLPVVRVVDFAEERRKRTDRRVHLLGPILEGALGRVLDGGGQAILLLNRRGYANYIACPDARCGWVMACDDCDATMVYHRATLPAGAAGFARGGFVRCHHCEAEQRLPPTCPTCGRRTITFGLGTQRVEEELARTFAQLEAGRTMARVDSDAVRGAREIHDILARFGAGELRVLLGTQMIAKGLDFPGVRLVGVVNADTAINLPDFRAAERTFQLIAQVAGRCGRGDAGPGSAAGGAEVIVQSFNPHVPAIRLAAAGDYESFARLELTERRRLGLPPCARMARVVVRDPDLARCAERARLMAAHLRDAAPASVRVRGPAACPIARIAGRHRQQIELLAERAAPLHETLAAARNAGILRPGEATAIDVDPIALL
jgi:primosomal protein N' (replication factor Y)